MILDKPGRGADQFQLRLPEGMRERIKAAADRNGRSMNTEIVAALEEHFPPLKLDVSAVETVLHYIHNATTEAQVKARVEEVNARFLTMGSPLRVTIAEDKSVIITTEF